MVYATRVLSTIPIILSQNKRTRQWNRPRKIRNGKFREKNIFVGPDNKKKISQFTEKNTHRDNNVLLFPVVAF